MGADARSGEAAAGKKRGGFSLDPRRGAINLEQISGRAECRRGSGSGAI
jgi:hypothetical protein